MNRLFFTTIVLLVTICHLDAQNISCTITDENGQPMEFVTVSLRSLPDSAIVAGCITDEKGQFCIERKDGGSYIQASYIGYRTQNIPISSSLLLRQLRCKQMQRC